mmetsp:Transcript_10410/g.20565  ORF Transcript_10410/g.20565 Transcript_10410/m.20565 type:complete len:454 (+) Transcript_10410:117-1478(+)
MVVGHVCVVHSHCYHGSHESHGRRSGRAQRGWNKKGVSTTRVTTTQCAVERRNDGEGFTRESDTYFIKRLEQRGWDSARDTLPGASETKGLHGGIDLVWRAMESIYGLGIIETALMPSPWLQEAVARAGSDDVAPRTRVFLKMENTQKTGSFKARGAAFKVLSLTPEERKNGVVISSTGNHALAVLNAIKEIRKMTGEHIPVEMYLPETISSRKLSKIEREAEACGGHITLLGQDCVESEVAARRAAEEAGKVYISPYNDVDVVAGQGTIAIEILMATDKLDVVFVPVGGGGLISGVASALKGIAPHVKVIGCQPEASDVMRQSVEAGKVVSMPWLETLSEGTAGSIEDDTITLGYCADLVDDWVTVSESEIAAAMVGFHGHHAAQIEGAAAVTIASIIKMAPSLAGKHVVAVICGGNVGGDMLDVAYDIVRGVHLTKDEQRQQSKKGEASAF